ncbi:hypothetical protein [Mammaliicoccus sp. E-M24]|uniref:hypothetical protein n=1 Tax=Mammaliicoccus sp. E-M24 TaxID=2898684 RepID=UPI001EFBF0EB|nr:hypothetical protein [Mammaliicoccus sp. E-M24]
MKTLERLQQNALNELSDKLKELNFKHNQKDLLFIVMHNYNKEFTHVTPLNLYHYINGLKIDRKHLNNLMHEIQCYNLMKAN